MSNSIINAKDNIELSKLKGTALQEVLVEILNYKLNENKKQDLPSNTRYEIEIPFSINPPEKLYDFIEKFLSYKWEEQTRHNLYYRRRLTTPEMNNESALWDEFTALCAYLKSIKTPLNTESKIYIRSNLLKDNVDSWRCFIKLYTIYEHILYRFFQGDKLNANKDMYIDAPPIANTLYKSMKNINEINDISIFQLVLPTTEKKQSLVFTNVLFKPFGSERKTSELCFKNINTTTNNVIWQNYINTIAKMLASAGKHELNEDFLDFKLKTAPPTSKAYINTFIIKDALEFADLIFNNNLDKVYFLKQYFKNMENGYPLKRVLNVKNITER